MKPTGTVTVLPVNGGRVGKRLCLGQSVVALVPIDVQLVGSPVAAFAAVCVNPGDSKAPAVFDLLGLPPVMANFNGQQVPLMMLARYPLQYMGRDHRPFGWCWPEEWEPPQRMDEPPSKLVS